MKLAFRLETVVEVDAERVPDLIAEAERLAADRGGPAIADIDSALVELLHGNPPKGMELTAIRCGERSFAPGNDGEWDARESDLDAADVGVWLCRWPNGSWSAVYAGSKREAMHLLDQWGAADPALIQRVDSFGIDTELGDDGEFMLTGLEENFSDELFEFGYSDLGAALRSEDAQAIAEAVARERAKFQELPTLSEADTAGGKRIMGLGMDVAPAVADLWDVPPRKGTDLDEQAK